jgi:hypothetical protein
MAATVGTAIFVGEQSGLTYVVDIYLSDTVNTNVNFDEGVGAAVTTRQYWIPPEAVRLVDVSLVTGAAQTRLQLKQNGIPVGSILRHNIHLNTLALRPKLNIRFSAGMQVAITQLA